LIVEASSQTAKACGKRVMSGKKDPKRGSGGEEEIEKKKKKHDDTRWKGRRTETKGGFTTRREGGRERKRGRKVARNVGKKKTSVRFSSGIGYKLRGEKG